MGTIYTVLFFAWGGFALYNVISLNRKHSSYNNTFNVFRGSLDPEVKKDLRKYISRIIISLVILIVTIFSLNMVAFYL